MQAACHGLEGIIIGLWNADHSGSYNQADRRDPFGLLSSTGSRSTSNRKRLRFTYGDTVTRLTQSAVLPSAEWYVLSMLYGFSARSAEKPHTEDGQGACCRLS
jgi:hypothetical protein